jgi:pullulanase/glycogen debranching enzyme
MAQATELPPGTASSVVQSRYDWNDGEWLAKRTESNHHEQPMSIYEVHLGSWRRGLGYRELATQLVDYVTALGFTHVELLPPAEHPYGGSWGYQVTSYFAPTARFGSADEFKHLAVQLKQGAGSAEIQQADIGRTQQLDFATGELIDQNLVKFSNTCGFRDRLRRTQKLHHT